MKKNCGFSMFEVIVAMAMLTSTVYVLSDLHIRSMYKMMRERDQFLKIFLIKNALIEQLPIIQKKFKPVHRTDEALGLQINVNLVEPPPKSLLKDILGKKLALAKAIGSWKNGPFSYEIALLSFAQYEQEPKNDKK